MTSGIGVDTGGEPTRVATRGAPLSAPDTEAVVITAEIPAFTPGRARRVTSAGADRQPEVPRRTPAPPALRAAVWLLFVIVLLGLVGLAVEHFHPSWIAFLRNTTTPAVAHHSSTNSSGSKPSSSSGFALTSSGTHSATYSVPTSSSYEIVLTTTNRCFAAVKSPPTSSKYVFASTITPAESPKSIPMSGPSAMQMCAAHATSLAIRVGSRVVGTIEAPKPLFIYTFVPTGH